MVITPSSLCRQTRERALWRVQSKDVARLVVVEGLSSAFTDNNRLGFLTPRLVHTRATYLGRGVVESPSWTLFREVGHVLGLREDTVEDHTNDIMLYRDFCRKCMGLFCFIQPLPEFLLEKVLVSLEHCL